MYTREKAQLIWREALEVLRDEFSKIVFDTWIKTLSPIDIQDNYLILQTENKYLKQTLERRYLNTIINTIQLVSTFDMQVKIVLDENSDLNDFTSEFFSQSNLNPKYVFETFVRGKSNELAYAAALSIAEKPEDRYDMFPAPIHIGKGVWIGSGAKILPGVSIGDNAIVGAGAVVTKDVEANTIVVGMPAKPVRKIKE